MTSSIVNGLRILNICKYFIIIMLKVFIVVVVMSDLVMSDDGYETVPNKIRFPYSPLQGPFIGLFVAIFVPLDLPKANTFISYNFEANYNLPQNESEYTFPPELSRTFSRTSVYKLFLQKLKSHGYPGKACLLRTICEAAQHSLQHSGVLADIIHILLTPSSSIKEKRLEDYERAEDYGRTKGHCKIYNSNCPISVLDLISWVGNIFGDKTHF